MPQHQRHSGLYTSPSSSNLRKEPPNEKQEDNDYFMNSSSSRESTAVGSTISGPIHDSPLPENVHSDENDVEPGQVHRGRTLRGRPSIAESALGPPSLNYTLHENHRKRYIGIFFGLIFAESCILPLILFYSLNWGAHLSIRKNLAIITSLIGTVSGAKVGQRTYFLFLYRGHESRRPIGAGRWGMDFFQILITAALTAFFTPLIIGSSITPPSVKTVSTALPCFMLTVCIPMLISGLFPRSLRLPFRISSFPPHHTLPPLTYTIVEDVVAVDGGGKLEFRQAWRARYEESRVMRKLLRDIALLWGTTGIAVAGACIAISWTTSQDVGMGIGYGIPWFWAIVLTIVTIRWVRVELEREKREWSDVDNVHREKHLDFTETEVERDVYEQVLARWSLSFSRARVDGDRGTPEAEGRRSNPAPRADRHLSKERRGVRYTMSI